MQRDYFPITLRLSRFIQQSSENVSLLLILGVILLISRPRDRQAALHIQFNEYFFLHILLHIPLPLIILAQLHR